MTFVYFACCVFALCYLAADARIFGTDTTAWNEIYGDGTVLYCTRDERWLWGLGVFKIRQRLLVLDPIREHLSCYFCMGVWAGPAAHWLLWHLSALQQSSYWLQHPNTRCGWALGLMCSFLVGSCCSYFINAVLHRLES